MSLRPDSWIRQRARAGMIEPFEERQVRAGTISFGLSSYGYDIRIADEYKIFTNVNNSLVDPKNFDPRSFVDFTGEVCIVPPNSFALGRSVEYVRMPRNVLTIALGKSTYARCFRGDTSVALVDGTTATLEELARLAEVGETLWGYSMGAFGRVIVTLLEAPRYVGRDALLEIFLDDGHAIRCTPDHEFVLRDGRLAGAAELRPGTSLMPLYRRLVRGYEAVYQPINGHLYPTHRLADEWNLRHGVYANDRGTHRHHCDGNRRNNRPSNIDRMPAREHIQFHNAESYGESFDRAKHGRAIHDALAARWKGDQWRERYRRLQSDRAHRFWHEETYASARQRLLEHHIASWSPGRRIQQGAALRRYYEDPEHRFMRGEESRIAWARDPGPRREKQRELARQMKLRPDITEASVRSALRQAGSVRGAARLLGCDRSVFRRFAYLMSELRHGQAMNHKVARVRELPGHHDVYCLTVPEAGNFALAAGVFVRNCGIITNVTPLEPEWEGHVTLEISNTTPLPAKIYSNEGIAQLVFFESDQVCEVSYADRNGKYQAQRGVTLPRL